MQQQQQQPYYGGRPGRYGRPGMGAGSGMFLGAGAGLLGGLLIADAMTPDCGGGMGERGACCGAHGLARKRGCRLQGQPASMTQQGSLHTGKMLVCDRGIHVSGKETPPDLPLRVQPVCPSADCGGGDGGGGGGE